MEQRARSRLGLGVLLILIGALFLLAQFIPGLQNLLNTQFTWPLIVVGVGLFLFVFGVLVGAPGMAVPAAIVGGIGGILYWQNLTGNWESWAYAWTLIPGFVGVGVLLTGLLGERTRNNLESASWLIIISLVLFFIFGSFFGSIGLFGQYWPVLLILLGFLLLLRAFFRPRA
jgi:hypothetical protein